MLAEKLNQPDSQPWIDLEKQNRLWAQASNHQSATSDGTLKNYSIERTKKMRNHCR
jgi:hypothetical protein